MQMFRKVLTSTLRHQQPVNSAARNKPNFNNTDSFIQQDKFKSSVNNYWKTSDS